MNRVFMGTELEGVVAFWRIWRRDGVAMAFSGHDRDFWLDGLLHRAAPGMVPSSVRRSRDLEPDAVEVEGALSHDSISEADLDAGRFDGARIAIGLVDWETLEASVLYRGTLGDIAHEGVRFEAELHSDKAALALDTVPRTSPTCRAEFCGKQCGVSQAKVTHEAILVSVDFESNAVVLETAGNAPDLLGGRVRWVGGPHAGTDMLVNGVQGEALILDTELSSSVAQGDRAMVIEGCDHTLSTCHDRFGNAVNFRGEPFLPGNDMLVRYPTGSTT